MFGQENFVARRRALEFDRRTLRQVGRDDYIPVR
jgi:hypothetical protein